MRWNFAKRFRIRAATVAAVVASLFAGCGVTQNPSRVGNLPNGNIIQTHAKPPLRGYWHDFDPHAKSLTVTPRTAINQVGTQHVIIASVCDDRGDGRRSRRVEWHVTGVGHIVEVDESGLFPGRGYLVSEKYGVSFTNYKRHTITRGNEDPSDDIQLRPGQTFCIIYSPVEGETHVTCYAPGINDWQKHKVTVVKHWVDAQPIFPPPAINRAGEPHTLTTRVVRSSDGTGASGYKIRYRILDGPPAVLEPGGVPGVETITDPSGNGSVILRQMAPTPGVNRIQIDVVRPADSPTGREIVVSSHVTTKTWVAPAISVQKVAPPSAIVGGEVPYQITVTNTGSVATQGLTIRDTVPESLVLLRSVPEATLQGSNLLWNFGPLPAGQAVSVQFFCQATAPGTVTNCADAGTPEGLIAQSCTKTEVLIGGLAVAKTGPPTAMVGQPVTFQITVTNTGSAPISNVRLTDQFDAGFAPVEGSNSVDMPVGVIGPGESRVVPITLTPITAGRLCNRIVAQADGGLQAAAEHCVDVVQPQVSIAKTGPAVALVGSEVEFVIAVLNNGAIPATNVVVRDPLPPELQPLGAEGGAVQGQNALWNVGALAPGEQRQFRLKARAVGVGEKVCNSAVVSATGMADQQSPPACLEIKGVPGVLSELIDRGDPCPVGGQATYTIKITNQGSTPLTNLVVQCTVPPELKFLEAAGPDFVGSPIASFDERTRTVRFKEFNGRPGQTGMAAGAELFYQVQVQAVRPGDARFRISIEADQLKKPIVDEESTQCYDPTTGATNGSASLNTMPAILVPAGGSTSNYPPANKAKEPAEAAPPTKETTEPTTESPAAADLDSNPVIDLGPPSPIRDDDSPADDDFDETDPLLILPET